MALAAEYGLAVRVWLEAGRRRMRQRGLSVIDNDFLDSLSLDIDGKAAHYARLLSDLPSGLDEWAVHPRLGGEESQAAETGWRVRRSDYEFLTSPQARELLQQEGIVVIDYRTSSTPGRGSAQPTRSGARQALRLIPLSSARFSRPR